MHDAGRYTQFVRLANVDGTPVARDDTARKILRGVTALVVEAANIEDIRRIMRD